MPIYDYQCQSCDKEYHNIKNTIDDRKTGAPECCGELAHIVIRPPRDAYVKFFEPYECPVTGKGVGSVSQRKNIMAEHNLIAGGDIRLRSVKEY